MACAAPPTANLALRAAPGAAPASATRRLLGLSLAVLAGHLWLAEGLVQQQVGWGRGDRAAPAIEVAFVRELQAATPPPSPRALPAAAARLPALARRAQPASAPAPADAPDAPYAPDRSAQAMPAQAAADLAATLPQAEPAAPGGPAPEAAAASSPAREAESAHALAAALAASVAVNDSADAARPPPPLPAMRPAEPAAQPFDWPPSTRMNYVLNGHYRGPVSGTAQVEWLREGSRYQVRMRTAIGPVLSRQIVSEGELTDQGLAPRRFDGEQKVLFSAARRWSLRFGPERITLADGRELGTLPGAQDEASQFVQLTWLFTTRPDRLAVGQSIELPLIVSRSLDRWVYDVVAEETLQFPFGAVPTFHVKPRRPAQSGDLAAEIWFAPSLQYLPVRILIRQREDSWADLTLERPPLQAAPSR